MTNKTGQNNKYPFDFRKVLERFSAEERERVQTIWEISAQTIPDLPKVTEGETENALSRIHQRLESNQSGVSNQLDSNTKWRWLSAAAVLLLVFGAGIFVIPKTVTAPPGEIVTAELPDGSEVELNSGTKIQYNRLFALTSRSVDLEGEAFFSVHKDDTPFIVNTHNSTIKVTGTEFNVRAWEEDPDKETEVAVSEGSVLFYPTEQLERSVTITPGQWSRWNAGMKQPTVPKATELSRLLGWREHKLMFNNKSLTFIFDELERRFDIQIRIDDAVIGRETLTTYYKNPEGAESVIRDICRVKGLRYAQTAGGFRLYK